MSTGGLPPQRGPRPNRPSPAGARATGPVGPSQRRSGAAPLRSRRRMPLRKRDGGGGRGLGILGLILVVILLNVLSSVFHWGYFFY